MSPLTEVRLFHDLCLQCHELSVIVQKEHVISVLGDRKYFLSFYIFANTWKGQDITGLDTPKIMSVNWVSFGSGNGWIWCRHFGDNFAPATMCNIDINTWKHFPHYWPFVKNPRITSEFPWQRVNNAELDSPVMISWPSCLIHLPLMPHPCVSELSQHWFRWWLVAWSAPSHYLNQCWNIVD